MTMVEAFARELLFLFHVNRLGGINNRLQLDRVAACR